MNAFLRVLSFNIRGQVKKDNENAWPLRAERNVAVLLAANADLIGFQEMQEENWAVYETRLPGYERRWGPEYNNRAPFCYPSIFWRPEKLTALAEGKFWLSETPAVHSGSWETDCFRSAHWIRFRYAEGGEFLFLNTHLDHISERARVEGSALIVARLEELAGGAPVLITGDFNCDPGSAAYRHFAQAGYGDVYLESGGRDDEHAFTFHAFRGVRHPKYGRIDWILTRPGRHAAFAAQGCRIVTDAQPPLFPSDHYPVLAEVRLCGT